MTNDRLGTLADDGAVGFANDRTLAFADFAALTAQLLNPVQRLSLSRQWRNACTGRSRRDWARLLCGGCDIAGSSERCGLGVRRGAGRCGRRTLRGRLARRRL